MRKFLAFCAYLISVVILSVKFVRQRYFTQAMLNATGNLRGFYIGNSENIAVCGEFNFAAYYADHMVLQRGPQKAVVWGHASQVGDQVTVSVSGQPEVQTTVVNDPNGGGGLWEVKLPAVNKDGPFTVTAKSSEGQIILTDVLFGDVWFCAGQSNMGFSMSKVINSSFEIEKALKFKNIRIFRTGQVESPTALEDLKNVTTQWTAPTQDSISGFSALCWLHGEYLYPHRNYPLGLVQSSWGGTPIEVWSSPDALAKCPTERTKRGPKGKSTLWNAMINPFAKMTITGAIWFQGEGGNPKYYGCQFHAMIEDWRNKFSSGSKAETKSDFFFGFAQLATNTDEDRIGNFPGLRWAQTADVGYVPNEKMPNTFMAVTMDLPDFTSPYEPIHSRYKQDVAARLVLGTRAVAYKEPVVFQGPFPETLNLSNVAETLNINYGKNIKVLNNKGFEVCCSNESKTECADTDVWVAAPITAQDTTSVTVSVSGCESKSSVGLRYEWRTSPCAFKNCAIYGTDTELPAPEYITTRGFGGEVVPVNA